jgi:hypothetical protein
MLGFVTNYEKKKGLKLVNAASFSFTEYISMPILFYFIILLRLTVEMMSHVLSNPNQIKKNQTKKNMNIKKTRFLLMIILF